MCTYSSKTISLIGKYSVNNNSTTTTQDFSAQILIDSTATLAVDKWNSSSWGIYHQ